MKKHFDSCSSWKVCVDIRGWMTKKAKLDPVEPMEPEVEVTEIFMPVDAVKDICEENVIECYSPNNEDSTNGSGVSEVRIGNSVKAGAEDLIVKTYVMVLTGFGRSPTSEPLKWLSGI